MNRFIVIAIALLLTACDEDGPGFSERLYFKDDARNRVYVLEAKAPITAEQALERARLKMHTKRQMTVVYIYDQGTFPTQAMTGGGNLPFTEAMDIALSPPLNGHHYYYSIAPTGNEDFLDCTGDDKGSNLCER